MVCCSFLHLHRTSEAFPEQTFRQLYSLHFGPVIKALTLVQRCFAVDESICIRVLLNPTLSWAQTVRRYRYQDAR